MMKSLRHPLILYLIINILLFGLLFFYRTPLDPKILYAGLAAILIFFAAYAFVILAKWGDGYLLIISSMLATIGIAMLCRININLGIKQLVWYGAGILTFAVSFLIVRSVKFFRRLKWLYLLLSLALFMMTQIFGSYVNGAKNWILVGDFSFQPSELIKLSFVFFLACSFSRPSERKIFGMTDKYFVMLIAYLHMGFFLLQRDWGSLLLFFSLYLVLSFVYEHDMLLLGINSAAIAVISFLGVKFMYHIQIRIANWLHPWADISNKGYQITQSLFAIASGGFFGTGLGLGHPQYIPEVHSDFIFSAICEEMGVLGGVAVILLYFILMYRGIKISLMLGGFNKCASLGLTVMLGLQTFIIIGGVTKLIPLTGITLPFISYGGSSLISSFAILGILQAMSVLGE